MHKHACITKYPNGAVDCTLGLAHEGCQLRHREIGLLLQELQDFRGGFP